MGYGSYAKAAPACYRGCRFDSLLELKFTLSLEGTHDFLREYVNIYYDPKTNKTTNYLREGICCYTPDFLVRRKSDGKATLIEVKPKGVCTDHYLNKIQSVAENYIRQQGYDWSFKIVYGEDIDLTPEQAIKLKLLIKNKDAFTSIINFIKSDKASRHGAKKYFNKYPAFNQEQRSVKEYIEYVLGNRKGGCRT